VDGKQGKGSEIAFTNFTCSLPMLARVKCCTSTTRQSGKGTGRRNSPKKNGTHLPMFRILGLWESTNQGWGVG